MHEIQVASLLGPVVSSVRTLSGRLKFTVRRPKFKKDSLFSLFGGGVGARGGTERAHISILKGVGAWIAWMKTGTTENAVGPLRAVMYFGSYVEAVKAYSTLGMTQNVFQIKSVSKLDLERVLPSRKRIAADF